MSGANEHGGMRRRWRRFQELKRLAKADSLGSKIGPGLCRGAEARLPPRRAGDRGRQAHLLPRQCRAGLGDGGFPLLLAKPGGGIDFRVGGGGADLFSEETARRSGIRPSMATIMERALTWAVMLPRVISGLRLAISQRRARTCSRPRFSRRSPSERDSRFLLDELLLHGGPVLEHVGADTGFGFGVGGGVGVEARGFGGTAVGHGSREDQVGKGYFLISDGVADLIFGHRWLRGVEKEEIGRGFRAAC